MTDDETLTIQKTVIGGHRHIHDYTVIWRGKPIGRIMKSVRHQMHCDSLRRCLVEAPAHLLG